MVMPIPLSPLIPEFDDRAERIEIHLRRSAYAQLRAIRAILDGGVIRLQGQVRTYYLKQAAQVAAFEIAGTDPIENDIVVT